MRSVAIQRDSFGVTLHIRLNAAGRTERKRFEFALRKVRGLFVREDSVNKGWIRCEYSVPIHNHSLASLIERFKQWESTAVTNLRIHEPGIGKVSEHGEGQTKKPGSHSEGRHH